MGTDGTQNDEQLVSGPMPILLKTMLVAGVVGLSGFCIRQANDNNELATGTGVSQSQQLAKQSPPATPSATESQSSDVEGFGRCEELLKAACESAKAMPAYVAGFEMQEEVNNSLRPLENVSIKVRHEPFSVFMRWDGNGQEALYVHGRNDNRLIVKPTTGLPALRRVWRLDPESRMAMRTCRYPITEIGIAILAERIYEFYDQHRNKVHLATFEYTDSTLQGRGVTVVNVKFKDQTLVPEYHSSRFCFDKENQLLVAVDNYGWSETGERRLIEHYLYHHIDATPALTDNDFTENNPDYQFVVR